MFLVLGVLALPLLVLADLVPTAPSPGAVFKQGAQCSAQWTPDTSGQWKQTFIELMTGPNSPMVHLATVATVDGTDPTKTSAAFPCPAVSPNAAIYFLQFTAQGQNATWTGRFAISDLSGAVTPPPNANQPDGQNVPWGTGKLLDSSQGSPPPPTAPRGQVDASGASPAPGAGAASVSASPTSNLTSSTSAVPLATSFVLAPSSSLSSSSAPAAPLLTSQPDSTSAPASTPSNANSNGVPSLCRPSSVAAALSVVLILARASY